MKKNLNFLNKVFVIKKRYNRQYNTQYVYFSNGYKMNWCQTDFCIVKVDNAIDIFQFENGIANHEQLNDRVFLENAIQAKYHNDTGFATSLLKSVRQSTNAKLYNNSKLDYNLTYNLDLVNHFILINNLGHDYTYISPLEYKKLDKELLKIIEFQVNRLDKGEELVNDYDEYFNSI